MAMAPNIGVEFANIAGTGLTVSRVGLGTWAIGGGWVWGGTEKSVKTIHAVVERGINLIDTAPAYGFGCSEEIVGRVADCAGDLQRDLCRHRQTHPGPAGRHPAAEGLTSDAVARASLPADRLWARRAGLLARPTSDRTRARRINSV